MKNPLALIALALFLTSCAAGPGGYATRAELARMPGLHRLAEKMIAYQRVVCPKCRGNEWRLGVIKLNEVNAFSAGAGNFYVTPKFLELPEAVQEAGLAHEIAHELSGHVDTKRTLSIATTGVFIMLGTIVPGAGYLNHVVNPLITGAFSREQELEADSGAIWIMRRAGKKEGAREMRRLIEVLKGKGAKGGGLFGTHPHPEDRIRAIDAIMAGGAQPLKPPPYTPPEPETPEKAADGNEGSEF